MRSESALNTGIAAYIVIGLCLMTTGCGSGGNNGDASEETPADTSTNTNIADTDGGTGEESPGNDSTPVTSNPGPAAPDSDGGPASGDNIEDTNPPTSTGEDDTGTPPDTSSPVEKIVFTDVTAASGIFHSHSFDGSASCRTGYELVVAGIAAGDYDSDGDIDVYFPTGTRSINRLYKNNGDGTFSDVAAAAGVGMDPVTVAYGCSAAPLFFDYDGDGHLDLLVNAINGYSSQLFRNKGDGTFQNVSSASNLFTDRSLTLSASAADYDRDGDLDLFLAHWGSEVTKGETTQHLWNNQGNGTFSDASVSSGIAATYPQVSNIAGDENITDFTFTPNFADYNNDGWPDLLIASDFGTSQIFLNLKNGTFSDVTTSVISDENGMGAAVEDYDNDGDLDWFVSSILDPDGKVTSPENWGKSGNRLYKNNSGTGFSDATDEAGIRNGSWGWGSCFADFNNDGWLDVFHVNGFNSNFATPEYGQDLSRLFISNKDGTFTEYAVQAGISDDRQGRGISCFDYDRDGDIDIFIANNNQPARVYRNDTGNEKNYLGVKLKGTAPNTEAIGARVYLTASGITQMREIKAGNNYLSQNPAEAHFGLGNATSANIRIVWPGGTETTVSNVSVNQHLVLTQ